MRALFAFVPVLPVLSIVACAWLMLNLTGLTWIRFGIWTVVGFVIYFALRAAAFGARPAAGGSDRKFTKQ